MISCNCKCHNKDDSGPCDECKVYHKIMLDSEDDRWAYYCGDCNSSFSIQSDKDIDIPVNNCCFCGSENIW